VKVVLDTNVYISGIFFTGPPYQVLAAWRDARIQIVVSPDILGEYQRVGEALASQFPNIDLQPIFELLTLNAEVVPSERLAEPVCVDPDDDKFLACALTSGAKYIISGDKHLLKASGYKGLKVISPRRFVDDYLYKTPDSCLEMKRQPGGLKQVDD
jgi:putative PIN family toxin of toxin-antitoxin system